jgi:DNA-binding beta-propeller fold protein YncE
VQVNSASFAPTAGWSCEAFPCENDIENFLKRIQAPPGFKVEHVGRFPGLPMQITYGPDGRLYATVLENGTRNGAVYALNPDGSSQRYSGDFISPLGLAFQPGTATLYVSARVSGLRGGGLWSVPAGGGIPRPILMDLPCCYSAIDNQPDGLTFGPDGFLYLGVGSLTDHDEPPDPRYKAFADLNPYEATILRVNPHTGAVEIYARGLRNPFDVAFDPGGQLYASDNGLVSGLGDRLLAVNRGAHYGWPYWGARGCDECPPPAPKVTISPDLLALPDYSRPRGLVVYTGTQFPSNLFGNLFVALWNGTPEAQRVVRIDPRDPQLGKPGYEPQPFVTGLIRPIDVILAPDGSLVIADYVYGHIWKVRYTG